MKQNKIIHRICKSMLFIFCLETTFWKEWLRRGSECTYGHFPTRPRQSTSQFLFFIITTTQSFVIRSNEISTLVVSPGRFCVSACASAPGGPKWRSAGGRGSEEGEVMKWRAKIDGV
jgi:hypothetical protein